MKIAVIRAHNELKIDPVIHPFLVYEFMSRELDIPLDRDFVFTKLGDAALSRLQVSPGCEVIKRSQITARIIDKLPGCLIQSLDGSYPRRERLLIRGEGRGRPSLLRAGAPTSVVPSRSP